MKFMCEKKNVLHILYENVKIVKIENYKLNEAHLLRLVQIMDWCLRSTKP